MKSVKKIQKKKVESEVRVTVLMFCFIFSADAVYSNELNPPDPQEKLRWTPRPTLRTPCETLNGGRGLSRPGGVAGDGQPLQQHGFALHGQGDPLRPPAHARLRQGGVIRRRGEEVHLRREEDLLPLRHLWPLVHHLALDHRAQRKTSVTDVYLFVVSLCI